MKPEELDELERLEREAEAAWEADDGTHLVAVTRFHDKRHERPAALIRDSRRLARIDAFLREHGASLRLSRTVELKPGAHDGLAALLAEVPDV